MIKFHNIVNVARMIVFVNGALLVPGFGRLTMMPFVGNQSPGVSLGAWRRSLL
jgi:hypothetical protein